MTAGETYDFNDSMQPQIGWRPLFLRELREQAEENGMIQATHDTLAAANVTVEACGDIESVAEHKGGLLFVGNHSRQFEFVALMGVLHQIGRTSMKNVVKFYVERQVDWTLGKPGTDIVLPVYPRLLDKDRRNIMNDELGSRYLFYRSLLRGPEARRATDVSLTAASDELSADGVVNIFPCGSITDCAVAPWRKGVGRIVKGIEDDKHDDVLVVPYHADSIRRRRLVAAVASRGRGMLGRPQHIDVVFGQTKTVRQVMDSLPAERKEDPSAITEALRRDYLQNFDDN